MESDAIGFESNWVKVEQTEGIIDGLNEGESVCGEIYQKFYEGENEKFLVFAVDKGESQGVYLSPKL